MCRLSTSFRNVCLTYRQHRCCTMRVAMTRQFLGGLVKKHPVETSHMVTVIAFGRFLEDKMNADNDVLGVGVQMILMVEDSVRFYSSILPHLYKFLLKPQEPSDVPPSMFSP